MSSFDHYKYECYEDEPTTVTDTMDIKDYHRSFVSAILDIGASNASPLQILENMAMAKDPGNPLFWNLTLERIKSHLQRFRKAYQDKKNDAEKRNFMDDYDTFVEFGLEAAIAKDEDIHDLCRNGIFGGRIIGLVTRLVMMSDEHGLDENSTGVGSVDGSVNRMELSNSSTLSMESLQVAAAAPRKLDTTIPKLSTDEEQSGLGRSLLLTLWLLKYLKQFIYEERQRKEQQETQQAFASKNSSTGYGPNNAATTAATIAENTADLLGFDIGLTVLQAAHRESPSLLQPIELGKIVALMQPFPPFATAGYEMIQQQQPLIQPIIFRQQQYEQQEQQRELQQQQQQRHEFCHGYSDLYRTDENDQASAARKAPPPAPIPHPTTQENIHNRSMDYIQSSIDVDQLRDNNRLQGRIRQPSVDYFNHDQYEQHLQQVEYQQGQQQLRQHQRIRGEQQQYQKEQQQLQQQLQQHLQQHQRTRREQEQFQQEQQQLQQRQRIRREQEQYQQEQLQLQQHQRLRRMQRSSSIGSFGVLRTLSIGSFEVQSPADANPPTPKTISMHISMKSIPAAPPKTSKTAAASSLTLRQRENRFLPIPPVDPGSGFQKPPAPAPLTSRKRKRSWWRRSPMKHVMFRKLYKVISVIGDSDTKAAKRGTADRWDENKQADNDCASVVSSLSSLSSSGDGAEGIEFNGNNDPSHSILRTRMTTDQQQQQQQQQQKQSHHARDFVSLEDNSKIKNEKNKNKNKNTNKTNDSDDDVDDDSDREEEPWIFDRFPIHRNLRLISRHDQPSGTKMSMESTHAIPSSGGLGSGNPNHEDKTDETRHADRLDQVKEDEEQQQQHHYHQEQQVKVKCDDWCCSCCSSSTDCSWSIRDGEQRSSSARLRATPPGREAP